jgi:hypothetical protein
VTRRRLLPRWRLLWLRLQGLRLRLLLWVLLWLQRLRCHLLLLLLRRLLLGVLLHGLLPDLEQVPSIVTCPPRLARVTHISDGVEPGLVLCEVLRRPCTRALLSPREWV